MVLASVQGVRFTKIVESMATARPDKPCNNVGCDAFHISEDCHLEPMCDGCGAYGSHFSHKCAAKCTRCGGKGHLNAYCRRHIHSRTRRQLRDRPVLRVLRPANDPPRQISGVMERIWAEVAKYQSAAADSSATQDPVPRQDTNRAVSGQTMASPREQKCSHCNKTGHLQGDCLSLRLKEMWRARKLRDEMRIASWKTVRN